LVLQVLPLALDPGHADSDDLCNMPPLMCNSEVRYPVHIANEDDCCSPSAGQLGMFCSNSTRLT
jgi:hypothetical protein